MDLETVKQHEVSQKEKNKYWTQLENTHVTPQSSRDEGLLLLYGLESVDGAQGRRGLLTEWRQALGAG